MSDFRFSVSCDDARVRAEVSPLPCAEEGVSLFRIRVVFPEKMPPPPVKVTRKVPMLGVVAVWTPSARFDRSVEREPNFSRFHYGAPILAAIGEGDRNRATVSLSDAVNPVELSLFTRDLAFGDVLEYTVTLFAQKTDALLDYETVLRIDERPLPYYETIGDVYARLWKPAGFVIPEPPAGAFDPLYSTWYNSWQNPRADRLLPDLKAAAGLGFRTVILDDGWQFEGEDGDYYAKCGDWQPAADKFPDFGAFVRGVHAYGMKLMVWFSVPYIGMSSTSFETFRGRYLEVDEFMKAGVLDIRYPEVRAHLIRHYRRFLTDYDIDGFKFDFIGSFGGTPDSIPFDPARMDCETVVDAVQTLLREISDALGPIKPGLLYEYRQGYIGPAISVFGNMLRVGDCPYDAVRNRVGITDLRLLGYPTAVHSDMLVWRPEESLRLCARQLLNVLFGVPQISIRVLEAPEAQRALLRTYIDYWTENRDTLLHGRFCPAQPEHNYPVIRAVGRDKEIAVLHEVRTYTPGELPCDVFLDCFESGLLLENPSDRPRRAQIFRSFDTDLLGEAEIPPRGVVRLDVPPMGMARIL